MHDLRRKSRTILTLEKLEYNVPFEDEDFTLQALAESAVRRWLARRCWPCCRARARAQDFTYRGFGEVQSTFYPQTTPQDDDRVCGRGRDSLRTCLQACRLADACQDPVEARVDNLEQVERTWRLDCR